MRLLVRQREQPGDADHQSRNDGLDSPPAARLPSRDDADHAELLAAGPGHARRPRVTRASASLAASTRDAPVAEAITRRPAPCAGYGNQAHLRRLQAKLTI